MIEKWLIQIGKSSESFCFFGVLGKLIGMGKIQLLKNLKNSDRFSETYPTIEFRVIGSLMVCGQLFLFCFLEDQDYSWWLSTKVLVQRNLDYAKNLLMIFSRFMNRTFHTNMLQKFWTVWIRVLVFFLDYLMNGRKKMSFLKVIYQSFKSLFLRNSSQVSLIRLSKIG